MQFHWFDWALLSDWTKTVQCSPNMFGPLSSSFIVARFVSCIQYKFFWLLSINTNHCIILRQNNRHWCRESSKEHCAIFIMLLIACIKHCGLYSRISHYFHLMSLEPNIFSNYAQITFANLSRLEFPCVAHSFNYYIYFTHVQSPIFTKFNYKIV